MWEGIARLPAVFPDGTSIDRKIKPWLITGIVRSHIWNVNEGSYSRTDDASETSSRRRDPVAFFPLQWLAAVLLAWGLVPGTQAYLLYCFVREFGSEPNTCIWSGIGACILAVTLAGAVVSYKTAKSVLRGEYPLHLWPVFRREENADSHLVDVGIVLPVAAIVLSTGLCWVLLTFWYQ